MASLGQELKKTREEKGLTLHQISANTLIGVRFLQALESDDYGILPGGVFNRAFVRKFAAQIGMEEATALQLYEEQLLVQGGETVRKFEMGVENWDTPPTSGNGLLISLAVVVVLLVGAYFLYSYFYSAKDAAADTPAVATPAPAAPETAVALPVTTPTPEPSPSPVPVEGLVLKIETITAPCWIKIVRDTEPAEESIQKPGESREYTARERLVVSLGNLPTLRLTINGRPVNQSKVIKTPKSVVVTGLILTRDNYLDYVD